MFNSIDRMCLRVGELLHEARVMNPGGFREWVEDRLPFGHDKARRLIAIHLAYRELPPETVASLPRPWQALYTLRHWSGGKLDKALESGEIGPDTTVKQAKEKAREWSSNRPKGSKGASRYSTADVRAGALMDFLVSDLDPNVYAALRRWVDSRDPDDRSRPATQ